MGIKALGFAFFLSILITPPYIDALEHSATAPGRMRLQEFQERLQTISNEVTRRLVERIDTRMASVNQRVTNRFSAVLDKLQSILSRFVGKANLAKVKGIDTKQLDSAIEFAQGSIDDAKVMVASQAANLYVIEIASESALRNNVGSVVSQLRTALRNVHRAVVDAKQAVQKVVMEYAKIRGSGLREENTATSSSE